MAGGIFLLEENDRLVEMTEEVYDSKDLLQELLATHPSLLAGDQINPTELLHLIQQFCPTSAD
jgi:hypothetical protein